jgi:isocitrate/isopropylmalate dehydrogenase
VSVCRGKIISLHDIRVDGGEFMPTEDTALAIRKVTVKGSRRIAEIAFQLASKRRRKVTAVHKANVMRISDGLFLREVRKVAQEYPEVTLEKKIVDTMAALLVRDPARFDTRQTYVSQWCTSSCQLHQQCRAQKYVWMTRR